MWALLMDLERVGPCIPGVTALERQGDESYRGAMVVRVGPVALELQGRLRVTLADREGFRAALEAEASDGRLGGGLHVAMEMELEELGPGETALSIGSRVRLLGALGQLGQPIIRHKAEAFLQEFAHNLSRVAADSTAPPP